MSFFKTPLPFAFDLSDYSLKILAVEEDRQGRLSVRHATTMILQKGLVEHGVIKNLDELAANTKQALKQFGNHQMAHEATIALPEDQTFLTLLTIEPQEQTFRPEKILEEAKRHIPMNEEDMYWDAATTDQATRVLFGTAPRPIADAYATFLEQLGFSPLALEIEAVALVRSIPQEEQRGTVALVDIGATRTGFTVVRNGIALLTTQLPFSSQEITESLATTLHCDAQQAETVKRTKGWDATLLDGALNNLMEQQRNRLRDALRDAIAFFENKKQEGEEGIQRCLLTGGGALLNGLPEALTNDIGLPTARATFSILPGNKTIDCSYATALGLATGGSFLTKTI